MTGHQRRGVSRRLFATEFNDISDVFSESDEEMAPKYALLPTGGRANRVFIVGVVTEVETVGDADDYYRARVTDPTGTFFVYAGEYEPEAVSTLRDIEPPAFVAIVGKPRTFETDDGDVNAFVRPETVSIVDEATRTDWVVETAQRTQTRVQAFDPNTDRDASRASEEYGESLAAYREGAETALNAVADRDGSEPGSAQSDNSRDGDPVQA